MVAWKVTGEPERLPLVAVTVTGPGVAPRVRTDCAWPLAAVLLVVGLTDAVPPVTAHATDSPDTAFANWSVALTVSGEAESTAFGEPVWLSPLTRARNAAARAVAVAPNVTGEPAAPASVAVALCEPAV